jgi:hypothetical protein
MHRIGPWLTWCKNGDKVCIPDVEHMYQQCDASFALPSCTQPPLTAHEHIWRAMRFERSAHMGAYTHLGAPTRNRSLRCELLAPISKLETIRDNMQTTSPRIAVHAIQRSRLRSCLRSCLHLPPHPPSGLSTSARRMVKSLCGNLHGVRNHAKR